MAAIACAGLWFAAPLAAQKVSGPLPTDVPNMANAQYMIIKDAAGTTVLRGRLVRQPPDGDEIERECVLVGTGAFAEVEGEGEVEVNQVGEYLEQQVEFEVEGMPPKTTYTVFIDAKEVGTFTTDVHGSAEVEFETPKAPATAKPAKP
jgi:hypothetical protein